MEECETQQALAALLVHLGESVSEYVFYKRDPKTDFEESGFEGGDTIYAIDRLVEPLILAKLEQWPNALKPILVVAEGTAGDGYTTVGNSSESTKFRLLIDPIDGTRGIMYDKRSAWFLAAIAPDKGSNTRLTDVIASAIVEIPTAKQHLSDTFFATKYKRTRAERRNMIDGSRTDFIVRPSTSENLDNGFAQVSNFFPGTKVLASELMEEIASTIGGSKRMGESLIFEDQYISTGGQFIQLLEGKDRFCCDLRPLFYRIMQKRDGQRENVGLQCHPYDVAGLMTAQQAGVVITDGWGRELDAPFDLHTPVHWCGYANEHLRAKIEPVIHQWLQKKGCAGDS